MEVDLEEIRVMCVQTSGVKNSPKAFNELEAPLKTLKRRKFYGVLKGNPKDGTYRACVESIDSDKPKEWGFQVWNIPGGRYLRRKVKNWTQNLPLIGETFGEMREGAKVDVTRPSIEFYRSQKEAILFLPVK